MSPAVRIAIEFAVVFTLLFLGLMAATRIEVSARIGAAFLGAIAIVAIVEASREKDT